MSLARAGRGTGTTVEDPRGVAATGRAGLLLLAGLLPGGAVAVRGFGSLRAAAARLGLGLLEISESVVTRYRENDRMK